MFVCISSVKWVGPTFICILMCVYVDYLTGSPCVCTYIIKHVCSYVGVCDYTDSRLSLEGLVGFFLPSDILLTTWKIESLCHLGKLELEME